MSKPNISCAEIIMNLRVWWLLATMVTGQASATNGIWSNEYRKGQKGEIIISTLIYDNTEYQTI